MLLPDRLREPGDPEPRECAGFSFNGLFRTREVSIPRDPMAERVGFEPTVPLRVHLISSQARSTRLRHLSAGAEASKDPSRGRPPGASRIVAVLLRESFAASEPPC